MGAYYNWPSSIGSPPPIAQAGTWGLALSRLDPTVNFSWLNGSPGASVGVDYFAVHWTGQVEPVYRGTYTFNTVSDDGAMLTVNGTSLVGTSCWSEQRQT